MDVIAATSVLITNEAQTFNWAGYGLKLDVPKGALPAGLEECRLLIKVGSSGQFALPENTSLVSAVYWLDSEPRFKKFSKRLTLEIQHCVKPTHTSKLRFIRTKCTQTHLPYKFKDIEGGVFTCDSAYGSVEVEQFSGMGIVDENPVSDRVYCAFLYYLRKGTNQRDIHFVITWNAEPHTTVSSLKYCSLDHCSLVGRCHRLSNRSTSPKVPQLDQTCQLSLTQIASHCSYLPKELFVRMDG